MREADICIISEGTYPYVSGGVSSWLHEMITDLKDIKFYIWTLMPTHSDLTVRYKFPSNVVGHSLLSIPDLPEGKASKNIPQETWSIIEHTFKGMTHSAHFTEYSPLLTLFQKHRTLFGKQALMDSKENWNLILKMYQEMLPTGPFKAYFYTTFVLLSSLYTILLAEIPKAKIYHALCTGYAGFCLHRIKHELNAPCMVTEHGIYSNERRIEISMAEWITDYKSLNLALEDRKQTLKDFWLNAFLSLSHACYLSCDEIISIFEGNSDAQLTSGAHPSKLRIIVPGIHVEDYGNIVKKKVDDAPVIAFVGRIVPIKDIKTFIRAAHLVYNTLPKTRFYAIGPTEEDREYFMECQKLVNFLGLQSVFSFVGQADMKKFYSEIDLVVLTSISEAVPRILMEAGAAGIPCVATNVGACRELCYGSSQESPSFGPGGIVTGLANPEETAQAILKFLTDAHFYQECSIATKKRMHTFYDVKQQYAAYQELYAKYGNKSWQE